VVLDRVGLVKVWETPDDSPDHCIGDDRAAIGLRNA
jgi:hypothetical protein